MIARTNAEDDRETLDSYDVDQADGGEIQIMSALKEDDDTLYWVGGFGYQKTDSSFDFDDGLDTLDVEANRISFHGGVEKQFPFSESARLLIQGGLMYHEIEADFAEFEIGYDYNYGDSGRENALGLYVALGLQIEFKEGLAGTLMYRPLEPSVDSFVAGDYEIVGGIDTDTLLLGITLIR